MLKKFLIILVQGLLLLMTACGGDSSQPPPQPPALNLNNPTDQQQLKTMAVLAQQTQSSCGQAGAHSLAPLLSVIAIPSGAGAGLPVIPSLGGGCSDNLINFIMMYTTMKNGQYANYPETRPWFISQLGGIINGAGAALVNMGYRLTPEIQQKLHTAAWQLVQRDIFSQPQFQTVRPAVCSGAPQFGLGC